MELQRQGKLEPIDSTANVEIIGADEHDGPDAFDPRRPPQGMAEKRASGDPPFGTVSEAEPATCRPVH